MRFLYPRGKVKALTFSYDDAQKFDRKLVEIFNKYGMKATFHLNSGTLADNGEDLFVSKAEVPSLYAGHEVACHGVQHKNLNLLTPQKMLRELEDDRRALEQLVGGMVQGLSYAYGAYCPEAENVAKLVGLKYSRTVNATGSFGVPVNFLEWHPTCHHSMELLKTGDRFLNVPDWEELPLMYVWGHSFEFGRQDNWDLMEAFCEKMCGKDDIWYATNLEICNYVNATRSLEYSCDGRVVYNPTSCTIWMKADNGEAVTLKSGETMEL